MQDNTIKENTRQFKFKFKFSFFLVRRLHRKWPSLFGTAAYSGTKQGSLKSYDRIRKDEALGYYIWQFQIMPDNAIQDIQEHTRQYNQYKPVSVSANLSQQSASTTWDWISCWPALTWSANPNRIILLVSDSKVTLKQTSYTCACHLEINDYLFHYTNQSINQSLILYSAQYSQKWFRGAERNCSSGAGMWTRPSGPRPRRDQDV